MNAMPALAAWSAPSRIGYDASAADTAGRVLPMLVDEHVAWLSPVRPDGTPHLLPTWFLWDGDALVVFSKPGAVKVRNLRANPRLMVALGDPEDDFSVGLIEAEAHLEPGPAEVPDAFFAKYAGELAAGRLDPRTFRALYTQAIRIRPTRFLAWHGRGAKHGATRQGMPVADDAVERASLPVRAPLAGVAIRVAAALDRLAARLRIAAVRAAPAAS